MTWFTRSDILEIFDEAQSDYLDQVDQQFLRRVRRRWEKIRDRRSHQRKLHRIKYRKWSRPVPPLPKISETCFYCFSLTERVVEGIGFCCRHAELREENLKGVRARFQRLKSRQNAA